MSPRDNGWNHLYRKCMKITSQAKDFDESQQFGTQNFYYASSDENSGRESSSEKGMEEARDNSSLGLGNV